MDPLQDLINGAIHYEVDLNKNPYLTLETIILRLYKKIASQTRVYPSQNEKTILFEKWHDEILQAYETLRPNLSHEEKSCVERVLSKDSPHTSDLIKFASCWYKYNVALTCKWFAVDGLLGVHPKLYVQDAFSTQFPNHNRAIRKLYDSQLEPEKIKEILEHVFIFNENKKMESDLDPDIENYVNLYVSEVDEDEITVVAADRKTRSNPQSLNKRKKLPPS